MKLPRWIAPIPMLFLGLTVAAVALAAPTNDTESAPVESSEPVESEEHAQQARRNSNQLRLDEITIEGEVDVPRVLFIESRDRLRRAEFLHHLFLRDVTELGREAPLGRGLSWSPPGPNEE